MSVPVDARTVPPHSGGDFGGGGGVAPTEPELWCAGLPLVGKRLFSEAERSGAHREELRASALGVLGVLGLLVDPALLAMLIAADGSHAHGAHAAPGAPMAGGIAAAVLLAVVACPIAGALLSLRTFLALRALRRERGAVHVLRFAGTVPGATVREVGARALVRARVVRAGAPHTLDVAEGSGRLVAVDERPPTKRFLLAVTNVAVTPPQAATAAAWLRPLGPKGDILVASRLFSAAERAEVEAHERRLAHVLRVRVGSTVLTIVLFAVLASMRAPNALKLAVGVVFLAAAIWDSRRSVVLVRLVRGLRGDLRERRIAVYARAVKSPGGDEGGPTSEVLSQSRLPWTIRGVPATWRTTSKAIPRSF